MEFNASQHLQTIHTAALIVPGDVNEMHKLHTLHIFYFIFRKKTAPTYRTEHSKCYFMCALYRIHNTILAFKRPSDLAQGLMQTLQVPIYATFLPAIDENQFAQAAK